jgi:acetyl esterase
MHKDYQPYLAAQSAPVHPDETTYGARRRAWRLEAMSSDEVREEMAEVRDIAIDLGDRTIPTRLYVPLVEEHTALVLYFHGGSFVEGDLETHDVLCRRLALDTKMRFLAVDYRLAPEFPFPAGITDAMDVTRYVAAHRSEFDVEGAPLVLMGDSAGGCLAAVASAELRGEDLGIVAQVLVYPTMGPEVVTDSSKKYGSGYLLEMDFFRIDYQRYLADGVDHTDPRVTPLFYEDLTGVPPAIIVVAECDPLRDEAVAYAGLLQHSGVEVELLEGEGMLHGFLQHGSFIADALDIVDDLARHLTDYVASH